MTQSCKTTRTGYSLNYIDFLRDTGRHFSVNRMLAMDLVKLRLERDQELSFLEFNYMCLQAYDFVELFKRHGCVLQMGGSDQWGNIVTGIDLGRRMGTRQLYGLTSPLLTTASGAKMGKTAQGAVWLDASHASHFRILAILAQLRGPGCRAFSESSSPNCPLMKSPGSKRWTAPKSTRRRKFSPPKRPPWCMGGRRRFKRRRRREKPSKKMPWRKISPSVEIGVAEIEAGLGVLAAFVKAGLVASTSEARRQIKGGGLKVNDQTVTDERAVIGCKRCCREGRKAVAREKASYFVESHLASD